MGIAGEIQYKLNSGTVIPALGNGTAAFTESDEDAKKGTLNAFKAGYRHFDTAPRYQTEKLLGACLKGAFEKGLFKREEVFVTSKVWVNDFYVCADIPHGKHFQFLSTVLCRLHQKTQHPFYETTPVSPPRICIPDEVTGLIHARDWQNGCPVHAQLLHSFGLH